MNAFNYMLVFLGAGLGASLRFTISEVLGSYTLKSGFPFVILLVNILGSFLLGVIIAYLATMLKYFAPLRLFFVIGLCGGFTTFSSFAQDTYILYNKSGALLTSIYILSSVFGAVFAFIIAFFLFSRFVVK